MSGAAIFANISAAAVILFAAGIALMIVELCIPGFGVYGTCSIICLVLAVVLSSRSFPQALVLTAIVLASLAIVFILFIALASHGVVPRKLVLKESGRRGDEAPTLSGRGGTALTDLHPAGCAEIDGQRVDVMTEGEYVTAGSRVTVIESRGSRTIVRPIK